MSRIFFPERRRLWLALIYSVATAGTLAVLAAGSLKALSWWVDFSDEPAPADVMVVLAGGYTRPLGAADLYAKGLAPELWLSRPFPEPGAQQVRALGVPLSHEEDTNRAILLKKGVPASKIHFYGHDVLSTADEAVTFSAAYPTNGKRVLVVTSRYHARRAKLIFRRQLRSAQVRVVATPYDQCPKRWWTDRFYAQVIVMEALKTVYFLLGGRFIGRAPVG